MNPCESSIFIMTRAKTPTIALRLGTIQYALILKSSLLKISCSNKKTAPLGTVKQMNKLNMNKIQLKSFFVKIYSKILPKISINDIENKNFDVFIDNSIMKNLITNMDRF